MLRKFGLLAIVMVFGLGLVAVAGCGDDEDGGSDAPASEQSEGTEAAPEATEPPADDGGAAAPDDADLTEAAEMACDQAIDSAPTIDEGDKEDLKGLCVDAATGDEQAARDFCTELVEASIPEEAQGSEAARDQAVEACQSAIPSG